MALLNCKNNLEYHINRVHVHYITAAQLKTSIAYFTLNHRSAIPPTQNHEQPPYQYPHPSIPYFTNPHPPKSVVRYQSHLFLSREKPTAMADDLEAAAADDRAPFLATPAGPAASGGSSARRWRCCSIDIGASRRSRVASRVSRVLSSADVRVACRGLALLLLLLVVGGVGSVAMRQMVSPEINALMRERQDLRQGLELLKLQVKMGFFMSL